MAQRAVPPTIVRGACPHDCPDTCAWQVTVQDGVAVKLAGDAEHPITRGGLCAKVNPYLERVYSPDRVLHPLRRVGLKGSGAFERVSWEEALDDIAARLRAIIDDDPAAILPFSYLGAMGIVQGSSLDRRFFARIGATRLVRSVCGGAGSAGVSMVNGTPLGMLPQDLEWSRFIIIWGGNPIVTNLHNWPLIRKAKERGATVVVIDPVRTRTAAAADWHVQPLPGTDAALALGMMRVIVDEGLEDADYVERYTVGFAALRERLAEYPLDRVASITGLPSEEIARLARAYASTRPAAIRLLIGLEHHANGAGTYRAIACLPALTGAWRDRGGGLAYFTTDLFAGLNWAAAMMPELEDASIRQLNMVQLGRILTDPALDPPIRALIVYGSNPMATMPNQGLIARGLQRDDLFTVVHEQFMTDTARFADYVLPATTQLEHHDLMWSWGHPYLALNTPAISPLGEAMPTTELFRRLASRLGLTEPYLFTLDEEIIKAALESDHPWLAGITWERLREEGWAKLSIPDPWLPYAEGGFPTASGKAELSSEAARAKGHDPLPAYMPVRSANGEPADFPLALITGKAALHFLNSSFANLPRHLKAEREPRVFIHPDDAEPRGIADGEVVEVQNAQGCLRLRASVGDVVRPGVVVIPSGWWPSLSPGGYAANLLTPDGLSDAGEGGDFHDARVEVAPTRQ